MKAAGAGCWRCRRRRPAPRDTGLPAGVAYENTPYNGQFTFVRIRFEPSRWGPGNYMWGLDLKWNHDYPRAESPLHEDPEGDDDARPEPGGGNILALDDPELFKYPVAYLCEPGFWTLDDAEAAACAPTFSKGGFLIVDDFAGPQWDNFEAQMRRVLPGARMVELDADARRLRLLLPRGSDRLPPPLLPRRALARSSASSRTTTPASA